MAYNTHMLKKLIQLCIIFLILFVPVVGFDIFSDSIAYAQSAEELGIGTIQPPPGTKEISAKAQAQGENIGLIYFMSNMITLFSVVMGVWVIFNGVLAGYQLLQSSGDASGFEKARTQITQSTIGLFLIVLAYTFTGVVGLIFFGDATIFLDPKF